MDAVFWLKFKLLLLPVLGGLLFILALPPAGLAFLMLVSFVPLIYAVHKLSLVDSIYAGFLFGITAYIFIPISVIPWGADKVVIAVLVSGTFFAFLRC
ncbi:MAG: apolipoprotein N-acyltransferase [Pseudomonadales bacterium]|jgi:apolipoprotein N-acyltransferase